jgi:hypothetical protein
MKLPIARGTIKLLFSRGAILTGVEDDTVHNQIISLYLDHYDLLDWKLRSGVN